MAVLVMGERLTPGDRGSKPDGKPPAAGAKTEDGEPAVEGANTEGKPPEGMPPAEGAETAGKPPAEFGAYPWGGMPWDA